ncbi:MAG: efflux RND transporter periplasmic adaptor subunit [Acetobacteraceae bacterium]|nr:efflux RND transporter periplasmic adaptor subunit [Acetobacteraceae bacterium]
MLDAPSRPIASRPLPAELRPLPPRRRRRWPWLVALLAVLAAAASAAWLNAGPASPAPDPVASIARGDLEDLVAAVGRLEPRDFVDVGTQVSGQLRTIHVAVGQPVKQGDLLAEIDPTVFQAKVEADQAQLANLAAQSAERRARLALAQQQLVRQRNLARVNATSTEAVQAAEAEVKAIEAQIEALAAQTKQTQSQLKGNEANLSYTRIYAPMPGTVVAILAKRGQTLNANQSAPLILRIADLSVMTVWTQVSEADVARLSVGMEGRFGTFGHGDRRWRGSLRQIMPTPEVVNNVVLYNAVFDVPNEEGLLLPMMTAQVQFEVGAARDVPLVPLAALRAPLPGQPLDGPGEAFSVLVRKPDGSSEARAIRTGVANRVNAAVLSGLEAGEQVVMGRGLARSAPRSSVARRPAGAAR